MYVRIERSRPTDHHPTVPSDVHPLLTVPDLAAESGSISETERQSEPTPAQIPLLDLFAGAGGLSIGLDAAGFQPIGAVEVMEDAAKTYEGIHDIDVDRRRLEDIPAWELRAMRGRVAVVAGGPPCQPWSTGGLRRGDADDRDGFTAMFRALELIKPEAFIIENVAGLESGRTRGYFIGMIQALSELLDYHVENDTLDAADYGVPQRRRRTFIVGMRRSGFMFPAATHGPDSQDPWPTAGSVLTPEPVGEPNDSIVTYAKNPDLRPSPYDGLLFNGGGRPINFEAPARTILASAGGNKTPFIDTLGVVPAYHAILWEHYKTRGKDGLADRVRSGLVHGARRITVVESAALQTFPNGITFHGKRSAQYTLIGNAVPPTLATAVGRALYAAVTANATAAL